MNQICIKKNKIIILIYYYITRLLNSLFDHMPDVKNAFRKL